MSRRPFSVPIDRRIFLRTGSTVALGFAVLSAIPERLAAAANNPFNPLLGVGFAPDLPPSGTSIRLIDADRLLMPDPAFISRAARVMVAGSHRGDGNRGLSGGLAVDAVFQIRGRTSENYPRFSFWSAAGRETFDDVSGGLSFRIGVPATTGITFIARRTKPGADVESSVPAPLEADNGTVTLSLGNVAGPKLQRGVYTFAFAESPSDRLGDWSSYVLAGQQGVWSIPGASFAYLILKVAYAS